MEKYDISSSAKLERIVKHSGHLKYTGIKNCKKCYFDYEIFIRKDIGFKDWKNYKRELECYDCRRRSVQNYMNKYLNEFISLWFRLCSNGDSAFNWFWEKRRV